MLTLDQRFISVEVTKVCWRKDTVSVLYLFLLSVHSGSSDPTLAPACAPITNVDIKRAT